MGSIVQVGWIAFEDWRHATKLDSFMKETFGDSPPFRWSCTHSHLALMGGFAFDTGGDSSIPLPNARYTLTPAGICFLAKHRPDLMPNITTNTINDKSKASPFAKALVLAQASWFCLQIITRLAMRMPISALELNTLAHVFFAFCAVAAWWYKPLDILEPILIPLANNPSTASLCAAMYLRSTIGYQRECGRSKCLLEFSWPMQSPTVEPKEEKATGNEGDHAVEIEASAPNIPTISLNMGETKQGFQFRYVESSGSYNGNKSYEWRQDAISSRYWTLEISGETQRCCRLAEEAILKHQPLRWDPFPTHAVEPSYDPELGEIEGGNFANPDRRDDYLTVTSSNWPRVIKIGTVISGTDEYTALFGLVASGVLYGGIHLFAWDGPLHTDTELLLWRIAVVTLVSAGGFVLLCFGIFFLDEFFKRSSYSSNPLYLFFRAMFFCLGLSIACSPATLLGGVMYVLSRVYLVVEGLISLPFVPEEVFLQPQWSKYFPHIA